MTMSCYKSGDNNKFDNNEDKVYLLLKDDIDGSYIRSRARSYNLGSHDHDFIIAFFFGISSNKQIIVKKLFANK